MIDRRHYVPVSLGLRLPVLVGLLAVVVNYAAPHVLSRGVEHAGVGDSSTKRGANAVAAPFNVAAQEVHGSAQAVDSFSRGPNVKTIQTAPASAAPIWGDAKGAAFVLVRNPPCKPACREPVVREFNVSFTSERR